MMADRSPPPPVERVERLDPGTAAEVSALIERSAVHERHSPVGEHKLLRLREGDPGTFGLLARRDGAVAGYAHASRLPPHGDLPSRVTAELVVDPPHRGHGLGRRLVERLRDEALGENVARLDVWAHHADAASRGLAAAFGMRISRSLWQMALRLAAVSERHRRPGAIDGVQLRTYRSERDAALLANVIRRSFPDHPENAWWTSDDVELRSEQAWFDPSAILIAETPAGQPLGVHWLKVDDDRREGEVYVLGIVPEAQGRGIGRLLLLEGLQEMRRRRIELAFLYVDAENEPALRLYRQAGFRHEHLDTCYSLELPGR